jgi:asparagine synthase (glutamine-hydrolysing)
MLGCGLFDLKAVERLVAEHQAGSYDHSGAIWLLLTFEGFLTLSDTKSEPHAALAA